MRVPEILKALVKVKIGYGEPQSVIFSHTILTHNCKKHHFVGCKNFHQLVVIGFLSAKDEVIALFIPLFTSELTNYTKKIYKK